MKYRAARGCLGYRRQDRGALASVCSALSDYRFDNCWVGKKLLRREGGKHLALRERNDAVRVSRDEIHVVFNEQYGFDAGLFRRSYHGLHDAMFLGRRSPWGRLLGA